MSKEYIERDDAKARLRIWITDCVLAGAKMDKKVMPETSKEGNL